MSNMSLARLTELLDAYGVNHLRWPAAEREQALQFLQSSASARALHAQAFALDESLDSWLVAPPSAALKAQIMASFAPKSSNWRSILAEFWRDIGGWRLAGPTFAASLALGAIAPPWLAAGGTDLPDEDLMAAVQMVEAFAEINP